MNYPVIHHLRVILSRVVRGERGGSFLFDRSALPSRVVEEGVETEVDEDDEDGLRFAILKSPFVNKETVYNW